MNQADIRGDAQELIRLLTEQHLSIAVAESLTGGGLCSRLVDVPGASLVLRGGACTYATETKAQLLEISPELLESHGPVHPQVALQMARGVGKLFAADVAIATTGVAGPGPADGHPAGTVFIACVSPQGDEVAQCFFDGDRSDVRESAIAAAICLARKLLMSNNPSEEN